MIVELKNDLVASWNDVEETITSLKELSDYDLVKHRGDILSRLDRVLGLLGKYVSEEDVIETL